MNALHNRLFWFGIGLAYLAFSVPLIPLGTDEIRMVAVFSIDESDILSQVDRLYTGGLFQRPSFTYGGGIYYVVLGMVWIWDIWGTVDGQIVAIALRVFCLLAGFGCLVLTAEIGRLVFDRKTGQIAAALLVTMPVFLHWTVEGHPDLPQLFWILGALYVCCRLCRNFSVGDVLLASVCAGIAFGTKYGGAFMLPTLCASVFLTSKQGALSLSSILTTLKMPHRWAMLPLIGFTFIFAFALINPYAIFHFPLFLEKMQSYRSVMSAGHTYIGESAGYLWLPLIVGHIGALHALVLGLGLLSQLRGLRAERLILVGWSMTLLLYLMLNVQMRHMRHILPILPSLLLFMAAGYRLLADWTGARLKVPSQVWVLILVGIGSIGPAQTAATIFRGKWSATSGREEVTAGRWLSETYPETTTILYDAYAYIPGKFQQALPATPAMTYPIVTHFEPDVLFLREERHNRYTNLADSNRVSIPKNDFFDIHYFYPYVRKGMLTDYRMVRSFGKSMIFERASARAHSFSFASCYEMLGKGQMLNEVSARERMGDAAIQAGDWHEAVREYGLGLSSFPDLVTLQYKLGRARALIGDAQESERLFEAVLAKRKAISAGEKADILWDMGQYYFAGGLYGQSLKVLEGAAELQNDKPPIYFDIAACHLALGHLGLADRLYAEAVERFGADSSAVVKLRAIKDRGLQSKDVDRLLGNLF
ncbi:MAG: glycosyltransferase family 39 protein [bacterium]|jgi:tetratricopeptide (TPR) repeat protein|nr:glycosyltransferase family 39 protein [bacterium]